MHDKTCDYKNQHNTSIKFLQFENIPDNLLDSSDANWILNRPELTIGAKALYIILSGMTFKYERATPAKKYLCELMNVSKESLQSYIDELKIFNLIKIHYRYNNSNYYELLEHEWMKDNKHIDNDYLIAANENFEGKRNVL
jgi:hypothetical protein